MIVLFAAPAVAAEPSYPIDTDPIRLGRRAADAGDWDEARRRFEEALAAGYHVDEAEEGLARAAVAAGRLADAEALYRQAIEDRRARGGESAAARAGLGLLLLRLDRTPEAAAELDIALAADADHWPAWYGHGRVLLSAGDREGARKAFARGGRIKEPAAAEAMYHHGMALWHLSAGALPDAEAEALVAAGLVPGDPEYGRLVAAIYDRRKIPSLAASAYERLLELPAAEPKAPIHRDLGRTYESLERWNDARDQYVKAVQADSTLADAWMDLGNLLRRAGQEERAAAAYRKFVERRPDDPAGHLALAEALLAMDKPAAAVEAAGAALALEPANARAAGIAIRAGLRGDKAARVAAAARFGAAGDTTGWTPADWGALAAAHADAGRPAEAAATFRRLVAANPASPDVWFQYGVFELGAGHADSARARFERSIALKREAPLAWLNLGIAELTVKETRRSIGSFRQALALDPAVPSGRLLLAQALAVSDSLAAAEAEYRRVLESAPGDARALRGLAYCQIRAGRFADAAKSYEAATKAEPANADGWAGLGNAYIGLGRLDAAGTAFGKARALDPDNATLKRGEALLEKARGGG